MTRRASWGDVAWSAIQRVNDGLADDVSLADRVKAVDAAYPFGERSYWPYKAWLKARRTYLSRYGWRPRRGSKTQTALDLFERDPVTKRPVIP
jgi:hypothetical protein